MIAHHAFLDQYQSDARTTAIYRSECALEYTCLGLPGEVGEIAAKVSAWNPFGDAADRADAVGEMGDVTWYVAMVAHTFWAKLSDLPTADSKVQHLALYGTLEQLALGLANHSGQIANKAKKVIRDSRPMENIRDYVLGELAAIL